MAKHKIFISSVQLEFASERQALHDYIVADALLGRFFDLFLFEHIPASNKNAASIYLREVEHCPIYLALLGTSYGFQDAQGISPTEREFDTASELHKTRLVFLSAHSPSEREEKQNAFIDKAQSSLVRRRFSNVDELKAVVYASLVSYLIEKEIIRMGPFDATLHPFASLSDIDTKKVTDFVQLARLKRGFPFRENAAIEDVFIHLNLINEGRITNAALLLFGKTPQRFFINSEIRCAHFHGNIIEKPINSYQVFKGDVFELVDQAQNFILSKLNYSLGTRENETSIPSKYEIPREIISEALVNAVAHRDYSNNGSVQVMLFRDRLEIINPGALPLGWSTEKLKSPHSSVPFNPLLAEPMYLKGYIERMGTGTADIVRIANENQLQEPEFVQEEYFKTIIYRPSSDQVPTKSRPSSNKILQQATGNSIEIQNLLNVMVNEMSKKEIQEALGLKHGGNFRENYLIPALNIGLIEMKYPQNPNHPRQKYFITDKGKEFFKNN